MKSKVSREMAQSILDDVLDKVPRVEILSRYGIKKAMFSRIKSGKWFEEQDARDAKNRGKYPKGMGWCKPCGAVVEMPCRACKIRGLVNGKRSRYDEKRLHAAMQSDGTCVISRKPEPLVFQLSQDEEEARQEVRTGVFGTGS